MKKIVILAIFLLMCGCGQKKTTVSSYPTVNLNDTIMKSQTVNSILFDNESIVYENNISLLTFQIKNVGENPITIHHIFINIKNENGTSITTLELDLDDTLSKDEHKIKKVYSDIDLTNAYYLDFSYE